MRAGRAASRPQELFDTNWAEDLACLDKHHGSDEVLRKTRRGLGKTAEDICRGGNGRVSRMERAGNSNWHFDANLSTARARFRRISVCAHGPRRRDLSEKRSGRRGGEGAGVRALPILPILMIGRRAAQVCPQSLPGWPKFGQEGPEAVDVT